MATASHWHKRTCWSHWEPPTGAHHVLAATAATPSHAPRRGMRGVIGRDARGRGRFSSEKQIVCVCDRQRTESTDALGI